jgi:hypothetical protein
MERHKAAILVIAMWVWYVPGFPEEKQKALKIPKLFVWSWDGWNKGFVYTIKKKEPLCL